ncbi:MAG: low molecular weight phosphotyrosine protein phosphatase [Methylococcales bacterium]|nr:low molecular weight phosphotyrosine protein phosphatase [Methylococcales bacterium]MCK5926381.1 low molecular weight phosphotyrosine protein phosphatase [Methylococcales bacterium]
MKKIKVLFVCMGNICRSPTAEGVLTKLIEKQGLSEQFEIDSAGTHAYHIGEQPDYRSQLAAKAQGVDLSSQRARKVVYGDFEDYDYLLAMDGDNYETLMSSCPLLYQDKLHYFLDYAADLKVREVPDPYYGGEYGFENVFTLIESASEGFLLTLKKLGKIE